VKILNYVENIVRNYDYMDFIMHFRLPRETTYRLIDQFSVSEIFTSLQGVLFYNIYIYIYTYIIFSFIKLSNKNVK